MEDQKTDKTPNTVIVIDSGPLKITGTIELKDLQKGMEAPAVELYLCRCGKSSNKPFCDESHKKK